MKYTPQTFALLLLAQAPLSHAGLFDALKGGGSPVYTSKLDKLDGNKALALGGFQVTFLLNTKDSAIAKNTNLFGRQASSDYAQVGMNAKLEGVPEALMQQITDAAFADLVSDLEQRGYTVYTQQQLGQSDAWGRLKFKGSPSYAANAMNQGVNLTSMLGGLAKSAMSSDPQQVTFAPTGMGINTSPTGVGAYGNVAKELGAPVVMARYEVNFATFAKDTDFSINYLKSMPNQVGPGMDYEASINLNQAISVTPGASLSFATGKSGINHIPEVKLNAPVVVGGAYGEISDTTSGASKFANALSSTLGAFSGKTSTAAERTITANPVYFEVGALKALDEANNRLVAELPVVN